MNDGQLLIVDRASLSRGGVVLALLAGFIASVISFATAGLLPDMTLLLDLPVEVGLARKRTQDQRNRFEAEAVAFHRRVREAYRSMAEAEPDRWWCVDAVQPADQLANEIWQTVAARVGLRR